MADAENQGAPAGLTIEPIGAVVVRASDPTKDRLHLGEVVSPTDA